MQQLLNGVPQVWFLKEVFHHILAFYNRLHFFQGEHHPSPQHTCPHRADRLVNDRQEAVTTLVHCIQEFKASHRELVHPHITILLNLTNAPDVRNMRV